MQVSLVDNLKDFEKLKSDWNSLLLSSGSRYLQLTYEWIRTYWKHFGRGKKIFVLLAKEEGELLGIAPLMIKRTGKFLKNTIKVRQLTFISDGFADQADFIVKGKNEEVIGSFFDYLFEQDSKWDEIVLRQIADDSPNYEYLSEISNDRFEIHIDKFIGSPYLPIESDFDTFYSSLKKKWTKEIDRKIKKVERERKITAETTTFLSDELLNEIRELNLNRNEATNRKSMFLQSAKFAFIKDLAFLLNDKGWLRFFLMRDDGRLVAYSFSFDFNNKINRWNTSYNLDYNNYSPGNYLMKYVLKFCFDNKYDECNFMAGEESYKFNWTGKMRENKIIILTKKSVVAALINLYPKVRSKLKERILPD